MAANNFYGISQQDAKNQMKDGDLLFTDGRVFKKEKGKLEEIKNA